VARVLKVRTAGPAVLDLESLEVRSGDRVGDVMVNDVLIRVDLKLNAEVEGLERVGYLDELLLLVVVLVELLVVLVVVGNFDDVVR
jgi:hypothetical protein